LQQDSKVHASDRLSRLCKRSLWRSRRLLAQLHLILRPSWPGVDGEDPCILHLNSGRIALHASSEASARPAAEYVKALQGARKETKTGGLSGYAPYIIVKLLGLVEKVLLSSAALASTLTPAQTAFQKTLEEPRNLHFTSHKSQHTAWPLCQAGHQKHDPRQYVSQSIGYQSASCAFHAATSSATCRIFLLTREASHNRAPVVYRGLARFEAMLD
jgi:hypothetical protein